MEIFPQEDYSLFFGLPVFRGPLSYYPLGAGIILFNGLLTYSSSHHLLSDFYMIFVASIGLYAYIKIDLVVESKKTRLIKRNFIIIWTIWLIYVISGALLQYVVIFSLINILLLLDIILLFVIIIFQPEALVLTKIQIARIRSLYTKMRQINDSDEKDLKFNEKLLMNYINSLPSEISDISKDKK